MIGYTAAGKRRFKSFYGKTQTEAKKKRNEFLRLMEAGMLVENEYVFDEWADMWFDNHKDNISPTTQESCSYTLKILKDYFCRRKLKDIKAYDIEQLLKKLRRDGRSDSCLTQCRGMLYQIFNKAEQIFNLYICSVTSEGVKDKTITTYKQYFHAISKRFDVSISISTLTSNHLDKMIQRMKDEELSPRSINSYTRTLKVFLQKNN